MTANKPPLFEHEPCSRCGGSGQYSYCPDYGTRCFKCAGSGLQYTARGAMASTHFEKALTRTTLQLEVGRKVRSTQVAIGGRAVYMAWAKIESIVEREGYPGNYVIALVERDGCKSSQHCYATTEWRIMPNQDEFDRAKADALAYQESLTKAGKPRKRVPSAVKTVSQE